MVLQSFKYIWELRRSQQSIIKFNLYKSVSHSPSAFSYCLLHSGHRGHADLGQERVIQSTETILYFAFTCYIGVSESCLFHKRLNKGYLLKDFSQCDCINILMTCKNHIQGLTKSYGILIHDFMDKTRTHKSKNKAFLLQGTQKY